MAKHKLEGFVDRRAEKFRNLPADYSRAKHRKIGPPNRPVLQDMTPSEFTSIKGAGPRY